MSTFKKERGILGDDPAILHDNRADCLVRTHESVSGVVRDHLEQVPGPTRARGSIKHYFPTMHTYYPLGLDPSWNKGGGGSDDHPRDLQE